MTYTELKGKPGAEQAVALGLVGNSTLINFAPWTTEHDKFESKILDYKDLHRVATCGVVIQIQTPTIEDLKLAKLIKSKAKKLKDYDYD